MTLLFKRISLEATRYSQDMEGRQTALPLPGDKGPEKFRAS